MAAALYPLCSYRGDMGSRSFMYRYTLMRPRIRKRGHSEQKRNEKADETQQDGLTFWGLSFRCSAAMSLCWARRICQSHTVFRSGER